MTREQHLKAIYIVGSAPRGKTDVLVMLCSGPDCGGAEMFARRNAGDVGVEANAHVDKMEDLSRPAGKTRRTSGGGGRRRVG